MSAVTRARPKLIPATWRKRRARPIMALRLPGNGAEGAELRAGLLLLYCRANTAAAGTLVFEQEYLPATASAATPRRSGHDYRTRRG